jgi:predicted DNA-binding transcriptional regulator YafY
MHASRLVSILLLLQARGRMTARELADELEVSLRTIYRDLDGLAEAGVPIYADRGPAGGYQLVDGYRTRLTGLSADEAQALFLSGLEGPAAQLGLGTVLAAAQLKVMAALPPELRGRAARLRERFLLVAPGWFRRDEPPASLGSVAHGVWNSQRVRFVYDGPDGPVERRVEPLGLVLKAGIWYLVARRDGLMRTYRASRIRDAECLDERFDRPEGFDLAGHWTAASEAFAESLRRVRITVRVRTDAIDELEYAVGGAAAIEHPQVVPRSGGAAAMDDGGREAAAARPADAAGRVAADGNAWTILTFGSTSVDAACSDLLRLGAQVEVIDPPALRTLMAATARDMVARYAAPDPAPRS